MAVDEKRIRLFLASDQRLFREAILLLLERNADMHVVGSTSDASEAERQVRSLEPDVCLLGFGASGARTIELIRKLTEAGTGTRVIALAIQDTPLHVNGVIAAGASGYLQAHASNDALVQAIRTVAAGNAYFMSAVASTTLKRIVGSVSRGQRMQLSEEELQVLKSIVAGQTNRQIAKSLQINESRVKYHLHSIFSKIGAQNRAHAACIALGLGMFTVPPQGRSFTSAEGLPCDADVDRARMQPICGDDSWQSESVVRDDEEPGQAHLTEHSTRRDT